MEVYTSLPIGVAAGGGAAYVMESDGSKVDIQTFIAQLEADRKPGAPTFDEYVASLERLPNGQIDVAALMRPPQGDRSAEGLKWHPAIGYHKDLGEAYWAGKRLTFAKIKQIQAVCDANHVSAAAAVLREMEGWTIQAVQNYFNDAKLRAPPLHFATEPPF